MQNSPNDTKNTEIWIADWIFFIKQSVKEQNKKEIQQTYTMKDVVTKRIPPRFLINEGTYLRTIKKIPLKILERLEGKEIKKFKIIYNKKIGEVN